MSHYSRYSVSDLNRTFVPGTLLFSSVQGCIVEEIKHDISVVPRELLQKVFSFLALTDLLHVRQVSRHFRVLENNSAVLIFLNGIFYGDMKCRDSIEYFRLNTDPLLIDKDLFVAGNWRERLPFYKALFRISVDSMEGSKEDLPVRIINSFKTASELDGWDSKFAYTLCHLQQTVKDESIVKIAEINQELTKLANKGHINAQELIGLLYCKGIGVQIDTDKGKQYLEKAVEAGSAKAMYFLGNFYDNDTVGPQKENKQKMMHFYQMGADKGNMNAQYMVGILYQSGLYFEKDIALANHYLLLSTKQGHSKSLVQIAENYLKGEGFERNYKMAIYYYNQVQTKTASVFVRLCILCSCGIGVERDHQVAENYFQLLLNQKNKDVIYHYHVGRCYRKGYGVKRNAELAGEYFMKSDQSEPVQFFLGEYYETFKQDFRNAYAWYKKAADKGYPDAQYKMAKAHALGICVELNFSLAAHYFQQLLELGTWDCLMGEKYANISDCFEHGFGTEKDLEKAPLYFTQAADEGSAEAQFKLCKKYSIGSNCEINQDKSPSSTSVNSSDPNHPECAFNCEKRHRYIGICLQEDYGTSKDPVEAIRYLKLAEALYDEEAASILGYRIDFEMLGPVLGAGSCISA